MLSSTALTQPSRASSPIPSTARTAAEAEVDSSPTSSSVNSSPLSTPSKTHPHISSPIAGSASPSFSKKTSTSCRSSRSSSLTHNQSLPPPPSSPLRHTPRQHHRQLSGERTTAACLAAHRELQQHFPVHYYHQQYNHSHQRQRSHPQLSLGPTATTLAQSPSRRLSYSNSNVQLSSHRLSFSCSSNSSSTTSLSTTSITSPRYHADNNSNNTATTLPPLPSFPPLPLHLELHSSSPVTSNQEHHQQQHHHHHQQQQQQHNHQGSSTSADINIDTNTSSYTSQNIPVTNTGDQTLPLLSSMTGALMVQSNADVGMHSLPIPTRHGHGYVSNNGNNDNNDNRNFHGSSSSSGFKNSNLNIRDDLASGNSQRGSNNNIARSNNNSRAFLSPNSTGEWSSLRSESSINDSRRSSKDFCESTSGTCIEDLVDQLIDPDCLSPQDQDARTRVFFLIYRRFMRPRELLEMFIARFDDLGDYIDDEQSDANNTRLRICNCLYMWLRDHPNDILHRQTRQRVAAFLRERVALFPCLHTVYMKLLPLSFISYFDSWRLHQLDHGNPYDLNSLTSSRNSSISGLMGGTVNGAQMSAAVSIISDEDSDSGYYDSNSVQSEEDMDEDREWGLADEDDTLQETASNNSSNSSIANSAIPDSIAAFAQLVSLSGGSSGSRYPQRNLLPSHLPARDRRSSTGSFAQSSSCTMENFVAGRRGSASSVSSNPGPFTVTPLQQQPGIQKNNSTGAFGECDMQSFMLQPIGSIPYINKRGSSHAYRQQRSQLNNLQNATTPPLSPVPPTPTSETFISGPFSAAVTKAAMALKDTLDEKIHPFSQQHGKSTCCLLSGLSPVYGSFSESSTMSSLAFIEVKDVVMAEQLTFLEYNIFKRLKPRDMLRHVWKTKKGSVAFQACISHFNRISRWVGTMILLPVKAKHRAKVMERFISIAKILRDMGNYNTTMAVIAAMNTSAIHRLIQTREFLQSKEIWNTFKELEHLMSSERSFFEYRSALRVTKLPCIPYLGVHSGDLLSISEGNRDVRQDGSTLHWQKFVLMTDVITLVMSFQQEPSYKIQPDPSVIRMIIDMPVLDDEALYSKSVAVEPTKLNHSRSLSKFTFF